MFNDGFYPSPERVQKLLLDKLSLRSSRVLEPSAGKGDLADSIVKEKGLASKVDVIEIENDLCSILQGKGYSVVGYDFLEYQSYTEYDAIIMNPPFDNGDKHLLHAINLAEQQVYRPCKISCILNAETIKNPYSASRKVLAQLLNKYSADINFYEDLFKDAERKTNVETVVIKLNVDPIRRKISNVYSTILDAITQDDGDELSHSLSTIVQSQELQERVSDIKTLVRQYEYHVELVKNRYESDRAVKYLEEMLPAMTSEISQLPDINDDIERVRGQYWKAILRTDEFAKKLTGHGRRQIYNQIAEASNLEINLTNIQMLLMAVAQNTGNIMLDSCVNLFERITQYHQTSFSANVHYYNGWKTNDAFKVNKKIILPFSNWKGSLDDSDMGLGFRYLNGARTSEINYENLDYKTKEFVTDLIKMFQLIDPTTDTGFKTIDLGEFENETIRFKMFRKGTIHFWIKDLELLEKFNVLCGQHFNWIPKDEEIRSNSEAKKYMQKEFNQYLKMKKIS